MIKRSDFDHEFYTTIHSDLRNLNSEQAWQHYLEHGMSEGRPASKLAFRENFLLLPEAGKTILEIGPFNAPVVGGPNVRYADMLSTEQLRKRATQLGLDPSNCPEITYALSENDLSCIGDKFDYVISSHCIEHQPDLVKHLNEVETILNPGGKYLLIVPDKRFCFDHFQNPTTIADIINSHLEQRVRHSIGSILEHRVLVTHNDPVRHWSGDHGRPNMDAALIRETIRSHRQNNPEYVDVHAWYFTPDNFQENIDFLYELGITRLRSSSVFSTPFNRIEFTAILTRN